MKYGWKLRYLIKEKGFNQEEIAKKIDVSKSTLSFWVNSEYPPLHGIEKICEVLNIDLYKFFMGERDLDNILPPGIEPYHIEFIRKLNSLPKEKRLEILRAFDMLLDNF